MVEEFDFLVRVTSSDGEIEFRVVLGRGEIELGDFDGGDGEIGAVRAVKEPEDSAGDGGEEEDDDDEHGGKNAAAAAAAASGFREWRGAIDGTVELLCFCGWKRNGRFWSAVDGGGGGLGGGHG